jgi:hypothetical protein
LAKRESLGPLKNIKPGAICQLSPILYSANISNADTSLLVKYVPRKPAFKSSSRNLSLISPEESSRE